VRSLLGNETGPDGRKAGSMNRPSEICSRPSRFVRHWAPHSDAHLASELGSELRRICEPLIENRTGSVKGIAVIVFVKFVEYVAVFTDYWPRIPRISTN